MADYFGPPKDLFSGFDPFGSYQKGHQFGLQNRARSELAKCKPDDFACMTRVLQGLDPEMAVRAAQVQGQLQHQKIIEGQGERGLRLREQEAASEEAARGTNLAYEGRRVAATEASQASIEADRIARQDLKALEDKTQVGAVVTSLPDFRTARDDIYAGGAARGATRKALVRTAEAMATALGIKDPREWAEANVPEGGLGSYFEGNESAKRIVDALEAQLPAVLQKSQALKLPYTPEELSVPKYVSPEDQAATDRNPPTESGGERVPPLPESAKTAGITEKGWAVLPKVLRDKWLALEVPSGG